PDCAVGDPMRVMMAGVEVEGRIEAIESSGLSVRIPIMSFLPGADYAHADTGNRHCVRASCSSPCELRRRCALRAPTFADRRHGRDVAAGQQCQNGCGDIGSAITRFYLPGFAVRPA